MEGGIINHLHGSINFVETCQFSNVVTYTVVYSIQVLVGMWYNLSFILYSSLQYSVYLNDATLSQQLLQIKYKTLRNDGKFKVTQSRSELETLRESLFCLFVLL